MKWQSIELNKRLPRVKLLRNVYHQTIITIPNPHATDPIYYEGGRGSDAHGNYVNAFNIVAQVKAKWRTFVCGLMILIGYSLQAASFST